MKYKPTSNKCSNACGNERREGQRLCKACHRVYMREWRQDHVYVKRSELQVSR